MPQGNKVVAITAKRLRRLLHYNPDTGIWTRIAIRKGYKLHSLAGRLMTNGYIRIGVDMKRYLSHRLAWLYMTGKWPKDQIDHINGNRSDNRWINLREASNSENQFNRLKQKFNQYGKNGVAKSRDHWRKKPFASRIMIRGKSYYLGRFETAEEAHKAYAFAANKFQGQFSRFK